MDRCFKYAIAQLEANPARGERLNVGLVVFHDQEVKVFNGHNLDKIRSITGALDITVLHQALVNIPRLDEILRQSGAESPEQRCKALQNLSALRFSPLGKFAAEDESAYQMVVSRLIMRLVDPEPALKRNASRSRTRLLASIKSAFKAEKILALKGEGLDSHRVLVGEELAEGLTADLILKNGSMHIMQTVDASHTERAKAAIKDIGLSSLVFEHARMQFGSEVANPRLIYSASSQMEKLISAALVTAEHQGARLINWDSRDDRTRFIVDISSLAEPATLQKRANFGVVHASIRSQRNLN